MFFSDGYNLHCPTFQTEEKMKKRWKNVKTGIKSHLAEVKADIADKLKGKV